MSRLNSAPPSGGSRSTSARVGRPGRTGVSRSDGRPIRRIVNSSRGADRSDGHHARGLAAPADPAARAHAGGARPHDLRAHRGPPRAQAHYRAPTPATRSKVTVLEIAADVAGRLDALGIPYAIGGSVASSTWGQMRQTNDIDIAILLSPPRSSELLSAFDAPYHLGSEELVEALAS